MGHGQRDSRRRREARRQRLRQTGKPRADAQGRPQGRPCAQEHVVRWALTFEQQVYEQLAQAPFDEAQWRDGIAARRAVGGPVEVGAHARAAVDIVAIAHDAVAWSVDIVAVAHDAVAWSVDIVAVARSVDIVAVAHDAVAWSVDIDAVAWSVDIVAALDNVAFAAHDPFAA